MLATTICYRTSGESWDLNKNILITAVDDYVKNWSKREGVPVSVLNEWSLTLKLIISNKINSFKKT